MTSNVRTGMNDRRRQDEVMKVAEQAAAWLIELEDGGTDARAGLAAWLEESPLHVEMFLRATSVDRIKELMAPADAVALANKDWTSERETVTPLVPGLGSRPAPAAIRPELSSSAQRLDAQRRTKPPRSRLLSLAAAVTFLCVALSSFYWVASRNTYVTKLGEQMSVKLPDGSMMHLNTNSRATVSFSDHRRLIQLDAGEALFTVQHDTTRPFDVQTAGTRIRAVGTQFNVYRRSGETKVAVIEGVVQVSPSHPSALPLPTTAPAAGDTHDASSDERLSAGQGVVVNEDGVADKPEVVNVTQVTAWRQRRLVFEWQTLEEIASEFNRYNQTPRIRVEGEDIRTRRYTAVFDADNPQTLLKFLSRDDHLQFAADGDDFVIRAR
ncbi:FecR family protein [Steroidobacter sp.]|uniref:FecR family protein n=1 Tax=Steroidobacter sp. TaxID=1978227 RepID=UPI001A51C1C8|nr:FecR domain-containing protein [Steroidobacter sp.]MBL8265651.1 FecR domain-containing protein [Steroidobacter sp.]